MHLNIRARVILGLSPGLFFLLFIAGVGLFSLSTLEEVNRRYEEGIAELDAVKAIQVTVQQALMPPNDALIRGQAADEMALFEGLSRQVDQYFSHVGAAFEEEAEQALLHRAQMGWQQVKATGFALLRTSRSDEARVQQMESLDAAGNQVIADLEALHKMVAAELDGIIAEARLREQAARRMLLGGSLVAILGGALFALYFSRSLTGPILALRDAAEAVGAGQWDIPIPTERGDELGDLGRAFKRMAVQLLEAQSGLERKVAERTRTLRTLNAVAEAASQSLDLEAILEQALDKVLQGMEIAAAEIFLLNEDKTELFLAAHRGDLADSLREISRFALGEGFPGRVAQCGKALISTNLAGDMRYLRRQVVEEGVGSFACVPLRAKGEVVGTLDVAAYGVHPFSEDEITLLENIGHQLGLAVENARLFQAEHAQRELADNLRRATREMSALLEPDAVYQAVLSRASQVLHADLACLLTMHEDELEITSIYGVPAIQPLRNARFPLQASPALMEVAATRKAHTFCEPGRKTPFNPQADRLEEIKWCLVVPLLRGEEMLGLLALEQRDHCYQTADEINIAWAFANHAAIAIDNARLYSRVRRINQELEARVRSRTAELSAARDLLSRQAAELRQVLKNTVRVQENERKRIAQEVHDGLTQWVMGALFELQAAKVCLPERPADALQKLDAAQDVLKKIKVEMRQMIYALRPPLLETGGLPAAIRELAASWQQVSNMACRVTCEGQAVPLEDEYALTVYRIIQEALNNVERHAQTQNVSITLQYQPSSLVVEVCDDGCGFEVSDVPGSDGGGHFGLSGMRERAAGIGGRLYIESTPGKGTRLRLDLPLTETAIAARSAV